MLADGSNSPRRSVVDFSDDEDEDEEDRHVMDDNDRLKLLLSRCCNCV